MAQSPTPTEAIDIFFQEGLQEFIDLNVAEKYKGIEIDFDIMRPFLFTAYNFFKGIDSRFEKHDLVEAKDKLDYLLDLNSGIKKRKNSTIEANFEHIYLNQNIEYQELLKKREALKREIGELEDKIKEIKVTFEELSTKIKIESIKAIKDDLIKDQKSLKGQYADLVNEQASKKDESLKNMYDMEKISESNIEEFRQAFLSRTEELTTSLSAALNYFSFMFDKLMWEQARTSSLIKEFFEKSGVDGAFSSKVFLKYYVKNLDQRITSDKTKTLIKYLEHLDKMHKLKVSIVFEDDLAAEKLKKIVLDFNPDATVFVYADSNEFLNKHKDDGGEVIFISQYQKNSNALDVMRYFRKRYEGKDKDLVFCLIYQKGRWLKSDEIKAKVLGVNYIIPNDSPRAVFEGLLNW